MYDIIGVNGNRIILENLPEEVKKESLSYEIMELLEVFGPLKKQLILNFFSERYVTIVLECLNFLLRLKKIFEHEYYITLDARVFDEENYSVPKVNGVENVFEMKKNYNQHMYRLELKQKAFAVFLHFRNEVGATRWYLNENRRKPWVILSFIAKEKLFFVVRIDDYQALYINDMMADPKEVQDRLVIVNGEKDKKDIEENEVKGVAAYVTIDENYHVTIKKP